MSTPLRLRAVSTTTLWALVVYGIYTYFGTILTNIAHLTSWLLAAALACFGLGAIAGNLAGGRLTDRWGGRTVSIVSLSALAVLDTVLGLTLDAPTAVLLLVLAAVALACGCRERCQRVWSVRRGIVRGLRRRRPGLRPSR